ncbi:Helix-loop-helix DNA-Hypothetical protein domain, partial [Nesidiocoris tenuis]
MTVMAQKVDFKLTNWVSVPQKTVGPTGKEAIHSGHFMVSSFEAEAQDDEDEVAVPVEEDNENKTLSVVAPSAVVPAPNPYEFLVQPSNTVVKFPWNRLTIETSLTKLFKCMSLAYRQKLTSPKWNRFKGIRLRWKDKIRLNNVIWRCWHMQFIKKKNTLVCQFASPLDADTHNKPEAVVLEGKYWKRKLNAVTAEYKKWRLFSHNQLLGRPCKDSLDLLAEFDSQDWAATYADDNAMLVDEDYMGLMSDTLFSTISANQGQFAFPDTREIARGVYLADFIQPSLVQLQPNLDEIMDIEPLHDLLCTRLPTVPEECSAVLPPSVSYVGATSRLSPPAPPPPPPPPLPQPPPPPYSTSAQPYGATSSNPSSVWYLPSAGASYEPQTTTLGGQAPPPAATTPPAPQQRLQPQQYAQQPLQPPTVAAAVRSSRGRKDDLMSSTSKLKKTRSRSEGSKKMATSGGHGLSHSQSGSSHGVAPSVPQSAAAMQSNSMSNSNALLAQLLTNTSSSTYGYYEDQSPTKNLVKEEISYVQQYKTMDGSSGYGFHSESDINKQSFLINAEANSNSSTASHCSPIPSPVSSTVIMKPLQSSMGNQQAVPSTSCPESPVGQESLSLSPLNVGSPTSLGSGKPAYREHRRVCHINAEQKRRCNIKNGFDTLHSLIPMLNQNPNIKMSKAAMLQKGAEYIMQLQNEKQQLKLEMDALKQRIETLNSEICNCQSMLPATGAPISKLRSNKVRDMYRKYVRVRVHENWKFWILSVICEPLLESFNNVVSTASMDELYRTTLQWVDQHCSLVDLRPIVLNALRHLCTTTDILSDPARLPIEARNVVDKAVKK